ncbi:MAG: SagB family peptide dehydrogenase [Bacteroidota bacterium]
MKIKIHYQFAPDTRLEKDDNGQLKLFTSLGEFPVQSETGALEKLLFHLRETALTEKEMTEIFIAAGGISELALMYYFLEQTRTSRVLQMKIGPAADPLVIMVSQSPLFRPHAELPAPGKAYLLSRFAFMRRHDGRFRLENPKAYACFVIQDPQVAAFLHELDKPVVLDAAIAEKSPAFVELIALLIGQGYLTQVAEDGQTEEDADQRLRTWEFHDLLFHSRSRMGRHDGASGATFPFQDEMEPLPAFKEMADDLPVIPLYKPDMQKVAKTDLPFSVVLESRCSVRKYGKTPITLEQIGEFFYRSARVRGLSKRDEKKERLYDMSNRPYPNGGASYELELYLTVNECVGLERGIYHYDPMQHVLRRVREDGEYVQYLLHDAWMSAAKLVYPQVLITYAPRFQRLSWKYRGMGYSASLKNVGSLYQTMYLVATAMGLAPCGLGNGNAELFARATGIDYYLESSTAEFILGSLPEEFAQN